jgi:RND superfamily putative drug exporter
MLRLARWSTTHRKYVVIGWVALLVAVIAIAGQVGTSYSNNFTIPNSDAQRAADLLQKSFPQQAGDRDTIVFAVRSGTVLDPAVRARMSAMFAQVARLPHVASVVSPYAASSGRAISADRRIAFATVLFDQKANLLPKSAPERVVRVAKAAAAPNLQVELGGFAIETTERAGFGISTAVGLAAAVVVLLLTFGSLAAMGLPILTALAGLGTGLGLIALFTHIVDTPNFSSELAAMIGLGVGIDYALFILTRFREAYATQGPTFEKVRESVVQAIDTAGRAILFAGSTVVIALLGMMLLGVSFLYGVALSASIGVLLVMVASLTLLPAMLTIWGRRVARVRPRRARRRLATADSTGSAQPPGTWIRWSAFVERHPAAIAAGATAFMLVIAAPAIALRLGSSDAANDPASQTTHRAYELLAKGFGPGFNGPLQVVATIPQAAQQSAAQSLSPLQEGTGALQPGRGGADAGRTASATGAESIETLRAAVASAPGVLAVAPPRFCPSGTVATLNVYPRSSPQAYATTRLVSHLRKQVIPPVAAAAHMTVYVGGVTAGSVDFSNTLARKLPLFIGVVVALSALLLMIVFRSLVIPLQAATMNLLSIGAALGVIVVVFQWGWFSSLFGVQPGPIESFIPVMLFAIVFGLSMDYEVFLVSRMHERWTVTRSSSRAVAEGLALTGRVVTAAAAIMVCVFLSFMLGEDRVIKEFGLSLASAVFLDAVVIRCLLLPAALHLIGDATWAMPRRLANVLPRLNVDGELARSRAGATAAGAPARAAARTPAGVAAEGAET